MKSVTTEKYEEYVKARIIENPHMSTTYTQGSKKFWDIMKMDTYIKRMEDLIKISA